MNPIPVSGGNTHGMRHGVDRRHGMRHTIIINPNTGRLADQFADAEESGDIPDVVGMQEYLTHLPNQCGPVTSVNVQSRIDEVMHVIDFMQTGHDAAWFHTTVQDLYRLLGLYVMFKQACDEDDMPPPPPKLVRCNAMDVSQPKKRITPTLVDGGSSSSSSTGNQPVSFDIPPSAVNTMDRLMFDVQSSTVTTVTLNE